MSLKDYSYIDFERIRSYIAQFDGALHENKTTQRQHQVGGQAKAGTGGVAKLLVEAEVEGNYLYSRSTSETSSLHHAIFDLFVQRAENNRLVGSLEDTSTPFTEITCRLKVTDYGLMANQFRATADLLPLIGKLTNNQSNHEAKQQSKAIKDIASAIELLFGSLRIVQLLDETGSPIAQAHFDENLLAQKSLFLANNNEPMPERWTVFALKLQNDSVKLPIQFSGNEMADALQKATDALGELKKVIQADQSVPSVIPIAIYRKLNEHKHE